MFDKPDRLAKPGLAPFRILQPIATPLDRLRSILADRCTLERELGAGGMATVYLAHDLRYNRKVAIKVLRPEIAEIRPPRLKSPGSRRGTMC